MLAEVTDLLACPQCPPSEAATLRLNDRSLRCSRGHSFDLARQGYVNLLTRAVPANADTATMVAARERFLATGAYAPIRDALAERVGPAATLVEAGAGTGYYLAGCLEAPGATAPRRGLALDISPAAARRAARAHPRIGAAVADTWAGLPVRSGVADLLLAVFAPRNPAEFARVLVPGGRVLVAVPLSDHLAQLRAELGLLEIEADKQTRLLAQFAPHLEPVSRTDVCFDLDLTDAAIHDLVGMGPNAFHAAAARPEGTGSGATPVSVAVRVHEFVRR